MKIEVKVRPAKTIVGDEKYITVNSVWNEENLVLITLPDEANINIVDGYALIDAIKRCVGRSFYQRD